MTSRTVTRLYDQELETVLGDDAACESPDCTAPAVVRSVAIPCGCARLRCREHQMGLLRLMERARELGVNIVCKTHPAIAIHAGDIHIYPV